MTQPREIDFLLLPDTTDFHILPFTIGAKDEVEARVFADTDEGRVVVEGYGTLEIRLRKKANTTSTGYDNSEVMFNVDAQYSVDNPTHSGFAVYAVRKSPSIRDIILAPETDVSEEVNIVEDRIYRKIQDLENRLNNIVEFPIELRQARETNDLDENLRTPHLVPTTGNEDPMLDGNPFVLLYQVDNDGKLTFEWSHDVASVQRQHIFDAIQKEIDEIKAVNKTQAELLQGLRDDLGERGNSKEIIEGTVTDPRHFSPEDLKGGILGLTGILIGGSEVTLAEHDVMRFGRLIAMRPQFNRPDGEGSLTPDVPQVTSIEVHVDETDNTKVNILVDSQGADDVNYNWLRRQRYCYINGKRYHLGNGPLTRGNALQRDLALNHEFWKMVSDGAEHPIEFDPNEFGVGDSFTIIFEDIDGNYSPNSVTETHIAEFVQAVRKSVEDEIHRKYGIGLNLQYFMDGVTQYDIDSFKALGGDPAAMPAPIDPTEITFTGVIQNAWLLNEFVSEEWTVYVGSGIGQGFIEKSTSIPGTSALKIYQLDVGKFLEVDLANEEIVNGRIRFGFTITHQEMIELFTTTETNAANQPIDITVRDLTFYFVKGTIASPGRVLPLAEFTLNFGGGGGGVAPDAGNLPILTAGTDLSQRTWPANTLSQWLGSSLQDLAISLEFINGRPLIFTTVEEMLGGVIPAGAGSRAMAIGLNLSQVAAARMNANVGRSTLSDGSVIRLAIAGQPINLMDDTHQFQAGHQTLIFDTPLATLRGISNNFQPATERHVDVELFIRETNTASIRWIRQAVTISAGYIPVGLPELWSRIGNGTKIPDAKLMFQPPYPWAQLMNNDPIPLDKLPARNVVVSKLYSLNRGTTGRPVVTNRDVTELTFPNMKPNQLYRIKLQVDCQLPVANFGGAGINLRTRYRRANGSQVTIDDLTIVFTVSPTFGGILYNFVKEVEMTFTDARLNNGVFSLIPRLTQDRIQLTTIKMTVTEVNNEQVIADFPPA